MKNHIKNILYQISGNKNETYIDLYIDFCLHNHSPELIGGQNHHIVSKTLFPEFQDFKLNQWNLSRLSNHNHYIADAILYYAIDNFTHGSAWYAMNNKNFITEKHRPIELIGPELYDKLISKRNKMVSDKYKNEVMAKRVDTGEILKVTREEFNNNENLVGSTKGKGGEHLKRTISVLDEDGNSKRISIDSEEYKCGNYIGHTVGKTVYKDKHGNTCMCSVDDPRVLFRW